MNDFTEKELKALRASISAAEICNSGYYGDKGIYEEAKKLYNKLQCMVDNYCEHKNIGSRCDADYVYECLDCDKVVGYE